LTDCTRFWFCCRTNR